MKRVCFPLKGGGDKLDEYKERHAHVWPDMLEGTAPDEAIAPLEEVIHLE